MLNLDIERAEDAGWKIPQVHGHDDIRTTTDRSS
jgi:hypothetical protein